MLSVVNSKIEPAQRRRMIRDDLERLRACAELDRSRAGLRKWREIMALSREELERFDSLRDDLPARSVESVAGYFGIAAGQIGTGGIDFREIAIRFGSRRELPERYRRAAFSRCRTPITSLEFLEKSLGWSQRHRALESLRANEACFTNPMTMISHQFITDFCAYLEKNESFESAQFFNMGAYSFKGNQDGLISEALSRFSDPKTLYECVFAEMIKFFEYNTSYRIQKCTDEGITVDVVPNPDVAEAMKVKKLGNIPICDLKAGMMASFTRYLNLPFAKVLHTSCTHRGDAVCRYKIWYPLKLWRSRGAVAELTHP